MNLNLKRVVRAVPYLLGGSALFGLIFLAYAQVSGPSITSLSPTSMGQGATARSLTINGSNFVQGSSADIGTAADLMAMMATDPFTVSNPDRIVATTTTIRLKNIDPNRFPEPFGDYRYRRPLTVSNSSTNDLPSGYSVRFVLDHASLVNASPSKSLSTGNDVRIGYQDPSITDSTACSSAGGVWDSQSSQCWFELDRVAETAWNLSNTEIWFATRALIPANSSDAHYTLFYGNSDTGSPPANRNRVYVLWEDFSGPLDTNPGTGWGESGSNTQSISIVNGRLQISGGDRATHSLSGVSPGALWVEYDFAFTRNSTQTEAACNLVGTQWGLRAQRGLGRVFLPPSTNGPCSESTGYVSVNWGSGTNVITHRVQGEWWGTGANQFRLSVVDTGGSVLGTLTNTTAIDRISFSGGDQTTWGPNVVDNILVRKYVNPEPVLTPQAEESAPTPQYPNTFERATSPAFGSGLNTAGWQKLVVTTSGTSCSTCYAAVKYASSTDGIFDGSDPHEIMEGVGTCTTRCSEIRTAGTIPPISLDAPTGPDPTLNRLKVQVELKGSDDGTARGLEVTDLRLLYADSGMITVDSCTFQSASQLLCNVSIAGTTAIGTKDVLVSAGSSGIAMCTGCFTVNAAPSITFPASPSSLGQGAENQALTIAGQGFQAGATVSFSGSGVIVPGTCTVIPGCYDYSQIPNQIRVEVSVAPTAATGPRDVTVINPDFGQGTRSAGFTVNPGPRVRSVSPPSAAPGTNLSLSISGEDFSNAGGTPSVNFSGSGITPVSTSFIDSQTLSVTVNIASGATEGPRDVTVVNPDQGTGVGVGAFHVGFLASGTIPAMVVYGESGVTSPRFRRWDGADWSNEASALAGSSNPRQVVLKANPFRAERVLGVVGTDRSLNFQVWNGVVWDNAVLATSSSGVVSHPSRSFDIAYEQQSGQALVVYGETGSIFPRYRVWNGSGWGSAGTVPITRTSGVPVWVRLEPKPNSNEILVVYQDTNNDINALIWNGSSFVTQSENLLENDTSTTQAQTFDVAYDTQSGQGVVAWAKAGTAIPRFRIWNGTIWEPEQQAVLSAISEGTALDFVRLVADPSSRRMALGTSDANSDLHVQVLTWDGSAWSVGGTGVPFRLTGNMAFNRYQRAFDLGWESQTSKLMATYGELGQAEGAFRTWTASSGWTAQANLPSPAITPDSTTLNISGGLSATGTTITVVSTGVFPSSGTILIDNEKMTYAGVTSTSFTGVTRGAFGTIATTHVNGATVMFVSTPAVVQLRSNPKTNDLLMGILDTSLDSNLDLMRWNGFGWTDQTVVETTVSGSESLFDFQNGTVTTAHPEAFMLSYDQHDTGTRLFITGVTPSSLHQGDTGQTILINGGGFLSTPTVPSVSFSGSGVTIQSTQFVSENQLSMTVSIDALAAPGPRDITVTNPDNQQAIVTGVFNVLPMPIITSVTPGALGQGAENRVLTITGAGFQSGATVSLNKSGGTGVTINSTAVNSSSQITVNVTLAPNTTVGFWDLTITNPNTQTNTLASALTINTGPTPTAVNPASRPNGSVNQELTITGTNFQSGASLDLSRVSRDLIETPSSFTFSNSNAIGIQNSVLRLKSIEQAGPFPAPFSSYSFRRPLKITNNLTATSLPSGYSVKFFLDHAALVPSKSLSTGDDVRIGYCQDPPACNSWQEVPRFVINPTSLTSGWNAIATEIWFATQADIPANSTNTQYYLYYGNSAATNPPADPNQVFALWEDFSGSLTGWTEVGSNTQSISIVNGRLQIYGADRATHSLSGMSPGALLVEYDFAFTRNSTQTEAACNLVGTGWGLRAQRGLGRVFLPPSTNGPCSETTGSVSVSWGTSVIHRIRGEWWGTGVNQFRLSVVDPGVPAVSVLGTLTNTTAIDQISFSGGDQAAWGPNVVDNVLVRKYVNPEPVVAETSFSSTFQTVTTTFGGGQITEWDQLAVTTIGDPCPTGSNCRLLVKYASSTDGSDPVITDPLGTCALPRCTEITPASTTLNMSGGLDATGTTITVISTGAFPPSGSILIDDERITYTDVTSTSFTGVRRGAFGTTATTHANGATVTFAGITVSLLNAPVGPDPTLNRLKIQVEIKGSDDTLSPGLGVDILQLHFKAQDITVSSCSVTGTTQLQCTVNLSGNPLEGSRDVTVINPDGGIGSLAGAFTVTPPIPNPPTVNSISPGTVTQGEVGRLLTITGSNFVATPQVNFSGTGVTATSVTVVDASTLNVLIDVDRTADVGNHSVSVINPDGRSSTLSTALNVQAIGDLTVTTGTSTTLGCSTGERWAYNSLTVASGASLILNCNMVLKVYDTLTVGANAIIQADGTGFSGGAAGSVGDGPGGGTPGQGGSHGGLGGGATNPGLIYGSTTRPVLLGSGGGGGSDVNGGAGGGAIVIQTNNLTLNGVIRANGVAGTISTAQAGGGGSGGSIWVKIGDDAGGGTLQGTGHFEALGGSGGGGGTATTSIGGGGGGGGRVAVYFTSSGSGNSTILSTSDVAGGAGGTGTAGTFGPGRPGSLMFVDQSAVPSNALLGGFGLLLGDQTFTTLRVRSGGLSGDPVRDVWAFSIAGDLEVSTTLTVQNGGGLHIAGDRTVTAETIEITDTGSQIFIDPTTSYVTFRATNLIVAAGARIGADGLGYAGGSRSPCMTAQGTGAGGGETATPCPTGKNNASGAGGGYGGRGGDGQDDTLPRVGTPRGGSTYGSAETPLDMGSGGGRSYFGRSGGAGGGAIKLEVSGTLTLDGVVSANGNPGAGGNGTTDYGGGGGSGGSIDATISILQGVGHFEARGGAGGPAGTGNSFTSPGAAGGGGGGGRIAVSYRALGSTGFSGLTCPQGSFRDATFCVSGGQGQEGVRAGTTGSIIFRNVDTTAPAAIADLRVTGATSTQLTLTWTAPGDDGSTGTATAYDLRYSLSAITMDAQFVSATQVSGEPVPASAGSTQSMTVGGLLPGAQYCFAIKTTDNAGNISLLNTNLPVCATTQSSDTTPPSAISDLVTSTITSSSVQLTWLPVGDDGMSGTVARYDLRYSTSGPITESNFAFAVGVAGVPVTQPGGSSIRESFTVNNLTSGLTYYFAIKACDEASNCSAINTNGPISALVPLPNNPADTTPPAAITDLRVALSYINANSVVLEWTARQDDTSTEPATAFELRYSTNPIDGTNFTNAVLVSGTPTPGIPGSQHTFKVKDLSSNTVYYFAIKAVDEAGNRSALSTLTNSNMLNSSLQQDCSPQCKVHTALRIGWNFVSVPTQPQSPNNTAELVFGDDAGTPVYLSRWDSNGSAIDSGTWDNLGSASTGGTNGPVEAGKGYFLFSFGLSPQGNYVVIDADNTNAQDISSATHEVALDPQGGFNMIANPYKTPVRLEDTCVRLSGNPSIPFIDAINSNLVDNALYIWRDDQDAYTFITFPLPITPNNPNNPVLLSWKGYGIRMNVAGAYSIIFKNSASVSCP